VFFGIFLRYPKKCEHSSGLAWRDFEEEGGSFWMFFTTIGFSEVSGGSMGVSGFEVLTVTTGFFGLCEVLRVLAVFFPTVNDDVAFRLNPQ